MASEAYARFIQSMAIGYEQWHDGIGYDLDALGRMPAADQAAAEETLAGHLKQQGDWRDVEALLALGTPRAMAEAREAQRHQNPEVRNYALKHLPAREDDVVRAVRDGAIELAAEYPTPRVKQTLLTRARTGDPTTRVNAAAMLMYIRGLALEPFDWAQRPFFLRFGLQDQGELRAAWAKLRAKTGL